ncbi:MAG: deoxyribonuclease IV [Thermoplasmata archaeon]
MYLGAHIGITGGFDGAVRQAREIGCESLQVFSKSPQMWAGPAIPAEAAEKFRTAVRSEGLRATAVHHGYLLNLANPKPEMLERSRRAFLDEIQRAELLGVDALVFHPGAHLEATKTEGLRTLTDSLRAALEEVPDGKVRLVLENSAGQGTTLCSTFDELAEVLRAVGAPARLGVLLDTCHLFAAGLDFRTAEGYGALVDRVDGTFGTDAIRGFHLNDAKAPVGSHLDRHENIGRGEIGVEGFRHFVNDRRWAGVPAYLETPLDERGYARYAEDLVTLRDLIDSGRKPAARRRAAGPAARRASTVK